MKTFLFFILNLVFALNVFSAGLTVSTTNGFSIGQTLVNPTITGGNVVTNGQPDTPTQINVLSFGAKHSGRYLVGQITSGSTSVTITNGSVSASDVGDYFRIALGASSTNDLVGTIASVTDSTHFTLSVAATNTLGNAQICIATNDDTSAIQSAINFLVLTNKGGTLVFPPGIYWVGGAIQNPGSVLSNYNAQLYFPTMIYSNVTTVPWVTLKGEYPPGQIGSYNTTPNFSPPASDSVLVSGLMNGGNTDGSIGGFISCINTNGHGSGAQNGWNSMGVRFENLHFRMPSDYDGECLNMRQAVAIQVKNCIFDSGYELEDARIPIPSHTNSAAIVGTLTSNNQLGWLTYDSVVIQGVGYAGLKCSEHTTATTLTIDNEHSGLVPLTGCDLSANYIHFAAVNMPFDSTPDSAIGKYHINYITWEGFSPQTPNGWWSSNNVFANGLIAGTIGEFGNSYTNFISSHFDGHGFGINASDDFTIPTLVENNGIVVAGKNSTILHLGTLLTGLTPAIFAAYPYIFIEPSTNGAVIFRDYLQNEIAKLDTVSGNFMLEKGYYLGNGSGLTNVALTSLTKTNATDGQVLTYSGVTQTWNPSNAPAGGTTLEFGALQSLVGNGTYPVDSGTGISNYSSLFVNGGMTGNPATGYLTNSTAGTYYISVQLGEGTSALGIFRSIVQTNGISTGIEFNSNPSPAGSAILSSAGGVLYLPVAGEAINVKILTGGFSTEQFSNAVFRVQRIY